MPYKGYTAITVKRELYEALRTAHAAKYGKARVKPSLSAYVSALLWQALELEMVVHGRGRRKATSMPP